jgi:RimJ/RimL family protein N-acetyltransferase
MFYTRIPRHIEYAQIGLRQLRFSDIPFLCDRLRGKEIFATNGLSKQISLSWLSVWWWIRKTFTLIYCIKCDSKRIGFIGLYNLKLGESAEMTLVIFDKDMRRLGYGSKVFTAFTNYLKDHYIVKKIVVRIKTDNLVSISFWQKLGFRELNVINDIMILHINLDDCH